MHSPTLLFALLVMVTLMTGVLYLAWRFNQGIGGLREWFFGFFAAFANIALFMARPDLSFVLTTMLLQLGLLATGVLAVVGIYRYLEHEAIPWRAIWLTFGAALVATLAVAAGTRSQPLVFMVGSVSTGAYFLWTGAVAWANGSPRFPARRLFAVAALVHGAFTFSRSFLFYNRVSELLFLEVHWSSTQLILVEQLVLTTLFCLAIVLLASERNASELKVQAELDPLTNLYNRRVFLQNLERASSFARRSGMPLSVLVLDVDHFKNINDTHGHDAGDAVLKAVARILQDGLRTEDVVGRMGGEEFAIMLPNTGVTAALTTAERIRTKINALPLAVGPHAISCTVSIGVTVFDRHESVGDTLRRGDRAMYFAKANGRDRVECALA